MIAGAIELSAATNASPLGQKTLPYSGLCLWLSCGLYMWHKKKKKKTQSKIVLDSLAFPIPECLKDFILSGYYYHKPNTVYMLTQGGKCCVFQ